MYHTLELSDVQQIVALLTMYDGSTASLIAMTCVTWIFAFMDITEPGSCACATSVMPHSHAYARARIAAALAATCIHPHPAMGLLAVYEIHTKYAPSAVFYYDRIHTFR